MTGSAHLDLPATLESPRTARQFVAEQLDAWGYDDIAADAALLTNELVANAVRHASEPYALEVLDLDGGVAVAVKDAAPELPVPRHPEPSAVTGRGLAIVEAVASAWGASPIPEDGKFVWFRLAAA